jgi:hypothetical protein
MGVVCSVRRSDPIFICARTHCKEHLNAVLKLIKDVIQRP